MFHRALSQKQNLLILFDEYCVIQINRWAGSVFRISVGGLQPSRKNWDFKRANTDSIRKAIKMIDWHFMLLNKNVHEQVSTFNTTLMDIFSNYIPNKYITVDDKDPPWMTEAIKNKINLKKSLSRSKNFIGLQNLAVEISELISIRKEEYYNNLSKKLNDPNTSA